MRIVPLDRIRAGVGVAQAIEAMREALVRQAQGDCVLPMPMHIDVEPAGGEVHVKAAARRGGPRVVVKIATGFPADVERHLPSGHGLMILLDAATGRPDAVLADDGWLTDLRTAAVTAMAAREIGREDAVLGILGSGAQARLQARLHAVVLPLRRVVFWGRTTQRVALCLDDVRRELPGVEVAAAGSPAEVASTARLIVTATASRSPLLRMGDIRPGTHLSAVGSDAPGKQELDPAILRSASLLLVDSRAQCARLGELQHAPDQADRAVELGRQCLKPAPFDRQGITVCDFTGLGVEDLFIAELAYAGLMEERP